MMFENETKTTLKLTYPGINMYIRRRVDILTVLMLNLLDVLPKSDDVGRGLAEVISLLTCMILLVSSYRLLHLKMSDRTLPFN